MVRFGAVGAALLALGGCTSAGLGGRSLLGGDDATANIVAQLGDGLIGTIGADLSPSERRRALEAEYRALEYTPSGQVVTWTGRDPARRGEVVAAQPYRVGSQDCRQYAHTVVVGTQSDRARGTACRNLDGSWTPLS